MFDFTALIIILTWKILTKQSSHCWVVRLWAAINLINFAEMTNRIEHFHGKWDGQWVLVWLTRDKWWNNLQKIHIVCYFSRQSIAVCEIYVPDTVYMEFVLPSIYAKSVIEWIKINCVSLKEPRFFIIVVLQRIIFKMFRIKIRVKSSVKLTISTLKKNKI